MAQLPTEPVQIVEPFRGRNDTRRNLHLLVATRQCEPSRIAVAFEVATEPSDRIERFLHARLGRDRLLRDRSKGADFDFLEDEGCWCVRS